VIKTEGNKIENMILLEEKFNFNTENNEDTENNIN
jgi:hypothetical protein